MGDLAGESTVVDARRGISIAYSLKIIYSIEMIFKW